MEFATSIAVEKDRSSPSGVTGTEREADHWLVLSELAGWEPRPVEKPSAANSCPGVLEFPRFLRGPRIFLIQPLSLQRESYVPLYARRTWALSVESVVLLQTLGECCEVPVVVRASIAS